MKCKICVLEETTEDKEICEICRYYTKHQEKWKPTKVDILFFAESPPNPRENNEPPYFYNENTQDDGGLWNQFNEALEINAENKKEFLKQFQKENYLLEDIFPTYQNFKQFKDNQYTADRPYIINRFTKIVNEYEPKKIVFVCKRAVNLLSLPFPRYKEENKQNFVNEIEKIISD